MSKIDKDGEYNSRTKAQAKYAEKRRLRELIARGEDLIFWKQHDIKVWKQELARMEE